MGKKTEDKPKTAIDQRFIERINDRQKDENFPKDPELSRILSEKEANKDLINKIRKGKQSVQIKHIELLSTKFNEDKGYIYLGLTSSEANSSVDYEKLYKESTILLEELTLDLNALIRERALLRNKLKQSGE